MTVKTIVSKDPWLEPYRHQLGAQRRYILNKAAEILDGVAVDDFALGHLYFGLRRDGEGWVFREWAPNATGLYIISEKTDWKPHPSYAAQRLDDGVWELKLPGTALAHLDIYALHIEWPGGGDTRLPSYVTYTAQDEKTHAFNAVVWSPPHPYQWRHESPPVADTPLIYEAHIGMSGDREAVSTYAQFEEEVLPRIVSLGYNTVQLMAIQEHPYYGSYGYQVSNFFAASSRFGTPDELKHLIDTAHGMGIRVLLDIVHSHAVKNEQEGLSAFDGTYTQYFHEGDRGNHGAWDSRVFDYGKPQVVHFLLSNVRFWLDEYHFDGFRFDGVTSMIYHDHGLERAFSSYDAYVDDGIEKDALTYLYLANMLAQKVKPDVCVIAEDVSAFPGIAAPIEEGGIGFSYRLSMGVPDIWIKTLKEKRDEEWDLGHLFHELTTHRPEERIISYAESHDQALVGDKTLIFRLIDKDMYDGMSIHTENAVVERGIALHKLIRLITGVTHGGGYLAFMGNEFGHPEWIDFPREGNDWSYAYARRQWHLADNPELKYAWLQAFDQALVAILGNIKATDTYEYVSIHNDRHTLSFSRGEYVCVINFSPDTSYESYVVPATSGEYDIVLSSDDAHFGGYDRVDTQQVYVSDDEGLRLYIPSRVGLVLKKRP